MGDYTGLMYYSPGKCAQRALPADGRGAAAGRLGATYWSTRSAAPPPAAIIRDDIRFVVLYRDNGHDADLAGFETDAARYRRVFENRAVVIYAPQSAPCTG